MNIRRYVVTIATTDDVDDHVSAKEIAGFLSDYIGNSYANLVECYRISDLQVVDSEAGRFTVVSEQERPEKCTAVQESTPVGVPESEVTATEELTEEQQAILDAPQHAELPSEQPAYGEVDMSEFMPRLKYPRLDVSKLNPPADARWVAVDMNGLAYYYEDKPHCAVVGWRGATIVHVPGRYDASNWQEAIWPVNLEQDS